MARKKVTVSLSEKDITKLDSLRGSVPRSDFVASLIQNRKIPPEIADNRLMSAFSECTTAIKAYIASEGDEKDALQRLDIYTKINDMTEMVREYCESQ